MSTLHASSLAAQLKATLPKIKGDRPLAFRCAGGWSGPSQISINGRVMEIRECRSDLEVREALSSVEPASLVLLVRQENRLSEETVSRFAKGKLRDLDSKESLLSLTGAQSVDPLLLMHRDVISHLVEWWSPEARLASVAGNIECGRVFEFLLRRTSLGAEAPDLVELLAWALEDGMAAVTAAPEPVRAAFFDWVSEKNGPVTTPFAAALDTCGRRLVSLGLVLNVLYSPAGGTDGAKVRLEGYLGKDGITPGAAGSWHAASVSLLGRQSEGRQRTLLAEADAWLEELKAPELAEISCYSPIGFGARLDTLARALEPARRRDSQKSLDALRRSAAQVAEHWMHRLEQPRMETIRMALRLTQWLRLVDEEAPGSGPGAIAARFLREDAFVDWARQRIRRGDGRDSLNKALASLLAKADERRKSRNAAFAEAARRWIASDECDSDAIPIENVIDHVVVPLARHSKVLLLVLDGMNGAVFSELLTDLSVRHWHPLQSTAHRLPRPVIAALPSITEVSRAALFRGRIDHTDRTTELVSFREHPALHLNIQSKAKPQLFLKPSLADPSGTGLSSEVRDAITGSDSRVVAVVINAVDDQLSTLGQLSLQWNVHQITWLKDLLDAAVQGNRAVILTSDHGHVPGKETDRSLQLKSAVGDRWRLGDPPAVPGELTVSGRRIQDAIGQAAYVASVSENLRYGTRKSGYHGGISDQEMVVPLAILSHHDDGLAEFDPMDLPVPQWWQVSLEASPRPEPPQPRRRKPAPETPPLELWTAAGQPESAASRPPPVAPPWIVNLVASDVLRQQRHMAQRISSSVTDDTLIRVLMLLDSRGGAVAAATMAAEVGKPVTRIAGFIANIQRLLNVDGYSVLEMDSSETVRLNREILNRQFDIPS
jgi:hypothetical protein